MKFRTRIHPESIHQHNPSNMTWLSSAKRKRGASGFVSNTCTDNTTTRMSPNPVRFGCDREHDDGYDSSGVCSIRDSSESSKSKQSSLLSFFVKTTKQPKPANANATSKTKQWLSSETNNNSTRRKNTVRSSNPEENDTATAKPRCFSSSSLSPSKHKPTLTQVYIDCGQSTFGQILCSECGMLYVPGIEEDEHQHQQMCQAYRKGIPCTRWTVRGGKPLDVPARTGRIVLWKPTKKKKQSLLPCSSSEPQTDKHIPSQWPLLARMISRDLGTQEETTLRHLSNHSVVLCIGNNAKHGPSRILGVATVQILSGVAAYEMIGPTERSLTPNASVKLGIGILWTHPAARCQGIATTLVDAAREHGVFGMSVANRKDVAFSSPTQAGLCFARRYSDERMDPAKKQRGPLVYEMDL